MMHMGNHDYIGTSGDIMMHVADILFEGPGGGL